jgi:ATP-dependent DNA ligase
LPEWIAPQLTQLVDAAPEGDEWLHEVKFDGYRIHAWLDRGAVKLLTCTGLDWTHKYPPIAAAVASLDARQAWRGNAVRRPLVITAKRSSSRAAS